MPICFSARSLRVGAFPLAIAAVLFLDSWVFAAEPAKVTKKLNGQTFTLPTGFTIESVAQAPLTERPIAATFDEGGRLYVTESSGSNDKPEVQLQKKPHRVVRLEDTDGDGIFDRRTVFADNLMFPQGIMWLDGSIYVGTPPQIWKLTDTNGDGIADERAVWYDGKTLTGCLNDLHGPYLGPDGRIYWTKGAFAEQTHIVHGRRLVTKAAHLFRAKPDGKDVESLLAGGMDNPVDVTFSETGEAFLSNTFLVHPAGGQRDGIIHAIPGGVWGKDHNVIRAQAHKWTSPDFMPVLAHLGPAACAGLHRLEGNGLGKDYRGDLFCCNFNLRSVTRHELTPSGATFTAKTEVFLASDHSDFHPTDVIEDADGSLLVVDTGGWYKLCCPTSQYVKPAVTGGIYRIRRANAPVVADPRGLKLDWKGNDAALAERLDDPRPAVRRHAIEILAKRKAIAALVEAIEKNKSAEAVRNAVWSLTRIESNEAREAVRSVLNHQEETVRQVAARSAALWCDLDAWNQFVRLLKDDSPFVRRAAAEGLERIGADEALPDLFEALAADPDPTTEHALVHALIMVGRTEQVEPFQGNRNATVRRSAMTVLDQANGQLNAKDVLAELESSDKRNRQTALWIVGRHPDWAAEVAEVFQARATVADAAEQDAWGKVLSDLSGTEPIQKVLAETAEQGKHPGGQAKTALAIMGKSGVKKTPAEWWAAFTKWIGSNDAELRTQAIQAARQRPDLKDAGDEYLKAVLSASRDAKLPVAERLLSLTALPAGHTLPAEDAKAVLARLHAKEPGEQSAALGALGRLKLSADQLREVAAGLPDVAPMLRAQVLPVFTQSQDDTVGLALVAALNTAQVRPTFRAEQIHAVLDKYSAKVQSEAKALYSALDAARAGERDQLEKLVKELSDGDANRGQQVFIATKSACSACHALGYVGGKIGPDLTKIGATRTRRDLLEALVFPSASFVRGYEPVAVATTSGRIVTGLIKQESATEVTVTIAADKEERIHRSDIESLRPGDISVMPAGLDRQLTTQELADLVAFLLERK